MAAWLHVFPRLLLRSVPELLPMFRMLCEHCADAFGRLVPSLLAMATALQLMCCPLESLQLLPIMPSNYVMKTCLMAILHECPRTFHAEASGISQISIGPDFIV